MPRDPASTETSGGGGMALVAPSSLPLKLLSCAVSALVMNENNTTKNVPAAGLVEYYECLCDCSLDAQFLKTNSTSEGSN